MELRPAKITAAFVPRTMGVFILLIIALSFTAGAIRGEMVLTLTGSLFLSIWIYSLVMILLSALFHHDRAHRISIRLSPEKIVAGEWTQVNYYENKEISIGKRIFQLPGIIIRCRILLSTLDGRRIIHDFKPEFSRNIAEREQLPVNERGAYFSSYNEFAILDIFGFFRFAFRIPAESGVLLAGPRSANESVPVNPQGGESERHGLPVERTDELISHRPYIPGDDPRRINWKLFSHGGELFIRQGEREPPPHSNITILIDTQFDSLYTLKSAREEVDLLCENALAIINNIARENGVQIGCTGQSEKSDDSPTAAEPGYFLAYPAAKRILKQTERLPTVTGERSIVILAMPRITAETTALELFLSDNPNRTIELLFIYSAGNDERRAAEKREAAQTCVDLYNRRSGVRARAVEVR